MGRKPKAKAEETDGPSNGHVDHLNDSNDQGIFKVNKKKRENGDANGETTVVSRRMPKRAAACADFKEKVVRMSEKEHMVEAKRVRIVEDEISAISLTLGHDVPRPNRRLLDFIFHDENGKPQPVEMLEVTELFITGQILPWDPSSDKSKEQGVKCEGFGRIETWDISGYEDGSPVVWISTDIADYTCVKPAASYKKFYGLFYEKARACIEVYKKLSPASGGDPDVSLEELLAYLVRSLSGSKSFPQGSSIRDFIISQGDFIYNQLIGLDETSKMSDQKFDELAVLVALRDESKKSMPFAPDETLNSCGPLKIGGVDKKTSPNLSSGAAEEDEDKKVARLLQEEEYWHSMKEKRTRRGSASSKEFYIKINEDEIANDYPMPAFYKSSLEETDEYVIFDDAMDISDTDLLPRSMLHDWSLYNSDARLISLELLPMKPCPDIDVTIYGSGTMTFDDGSGFCLDGDPGQSSSGSAGLQNLDGIPIFLSAVKEWMIEFGASMIFISIRTDMAWYRLGKPSKQYAPWYETVLKTAEVAIGIITLLKEQTRVARLSFADVIKKVTEFKDDHPAYISSDPKVVERYVIVHGQIILQQFAEYPDNVIRKCAFVSGLREKMELMHHTKWLVKKKAVTKKGPNMNPRAKIAPAESRKKPIPATTTRLINRIWGEFYSNYSPEESNQGVATDIKEDEELEEEEEEVDDDSEEMDDEKVSIVQKIEKHISTTRHTRLTGSSSDLKWDGQPVGKTCQDEALYRQVNVRGDLVSVGSSVLVDNVDAGGIPPIYYIEYMFEKKDGRKMFHGRLMLRGSETVLQNAANEREVFLTNQCADSELQPIIQSVVVKVRVMPWGYQYRKANADMDKNDRERAEDRKAKGLPLEYYCKSVYSPDKGAFFCLPADIGLGNGICPCCRMRETEREKETFKVTPLMTGFLYKGIEYSIQDYVYIAPHHFSVLETGNHTFKGGRNVGLKPYVICHLLEIETPKASRHATPETTKIKVRKFFRPEDISMEKAYRSDIREVYYSEQTLTVHVTAVEGKCEVRKKNDLQSLGSVAIFEHVFFCEHLYDPNTGAIKQLPPSVKLSSRREGVIDDSICRKKKGKRKEEEHDDNIEQKVEPLKSRLATLDIFAGCGGLSEGLQQAGVSQTKWAIEYEEPAGEAFCLNHPETLMFIDNCNVVLSAIMLACGDENDCISTAEATERAAKFDQKLINDLPRPGQVDFINGGPPCQGFSGMNRFNQSAWSKVQCEMILAFLSFADYFRPRYFLLENVRNFVSFNKGQTFRLALASLLEMGYQVRFGILEAGAFGVSQSRKRAFIWAASPEETLPEWPEPMHVFAGPELKITLDDNKSQFAAVRSTANGAPFRPITVRDTIGDLPEVGNGASMASMEYKGEPVSWFQKMIRGDMMVLTDHISKEMNELNLIRCQKIPKRPGADWRDLPDEKVRLSTGQMVDLIPWCLPNTAKRHNQWKGLYGRLDWEGNFPTSITDPQPMGKVGMCFHPDQDRIVTVRECARSQGFRDSYKFAGNIQHRHRQIGNAVPPPLAFALGAKLKEAVEKKI